MARPASADARDELLDAKRPRPEGERRRAGPNRCASSLLNPVPARKDPAHPRREPQLQHVLAWSLVSQRRCNTASPSSGFHGWLRGVQSGRWARCMSAHPNPAVRTG